MHTNGGEEPCGLPLANGRGCRGLAEGLLDSRQVRLVRGHAAQQCTAPALLTHVFVLLRRHDTRHTGAKEEASVRDACGLRKKREFCGLVEGMWGTYVDGGEREGDEERLGDVARGVQPPDEQLGAQEQALVEGRTLPAALHLADVQPISCALLLLVWGKRSECVVDELPKPPGHPLHQRFEFAPDCATTTRRGWRSQ